MTEKKGIGKLALKIGLITSEQLEECRRISQKSKGQRSVSDLLVERGYLSLADMDKLVKQGAFHIPSAQTKRRKKTIKYRLQKTMRRDKIQEHSFARRVLEANLATREQILQCIAEQERLAEKGKKVRIGQIMIKRGVLQLPQFLSLLQEHHSKTILECAVCEKKFNVKMNPGKRYRCKRCGGLLVNPQQNSQVDVQETIYTETPFDGLPGGGVVGNYQIIEELARGGMGVVYKARQRHVNRIVALKMIKEEDRESRERIHRFVMEARAAGKLRHPNIVPVHEFGRHFGHYYFTMDFIDGAPLDEMIHKKILTLPQSLVIMIDIARAVHYAHTQGIIHRDLKPANILIDSQLQPHITDFGLSKCLDGKNLMTQTQEGVDLGTPYYMCPEQVKGEVNVIGPRSDIYSMGVILYQILTDKLPFTGSSVVEVYHKILHETLRPPRKLNPSVPKDLERIVLKSMARDIEERYSTAEELAQDLERYTRGEPVSARKNSFEEGWEQLKNHPSYMIYAGVVLLLIAAVLLYIFHNWASRQKKIRRQTTLRIHNKLRAKTEILQIILQAAKNPRKAIIQGAEHRMLQSQIICDEAFALSRRGRYRQALEHLDRALALDPENESALLLRGDLNMKLKEYRRAIVDLSHLLKIKPLRKYYRKRITAYFKIGAYDQAARDCTHLLTKSITDSQLARFFTLRGLAHYKAHEYNNAKQDYQRAIRLDVKYPYPYFYLANLHNYQYESHEKALALYNRAILYAPGNALFYLHRGLAHYFSRRYRAAIDDFNRCYERNPEVIPTLIEIVLEARVNPQRFDFSLQQAQDFITHIRRHLLRSFPDDPKTYLYLGGFFLYNGKYNLAIKMFNKARDKNPYDSAYYILRGVAYLLKGSGTDAAKQGSISQAREDFSLVINVRPLDFFANLHRGFCYLKKRLYDQDTNNLTKALNDFNNAELSERVTDLHHILLGKIFIGKGLVYYLQDPPQYDKAAHEFERAIDVDARDPDGYIHLAMLMACQKQDNPFWNPQKALKVAQKAQSLNPRLAFHHYILAKIYRAMGQDRKAHATMSMVRKYHNHHPVFTYEDYAQNCP